jgi:hypothetical protein
MSIIEELKHPPFVIGQRVKIKEDGEGGYPHLVMGIKYEHRLGFMGRGWDIWVVEEDGLDDGSGGADGFSPDDLQAI